MPTTDTPTVVRPPTAPEAYRGAVIVFGTAHGKQAQVAPAFAEILGAQVIAAPGLDTDQFGTFTGDVARTLSPLSAARAKARLGMTATGHRVGLASEASYGPLPGIGWPGHEEILLFLDDIRGLEIVEGHRSLGTPGTAVRVSGPTGIDEELTRAGGPNQAVIVRPALHDPAPGTAGDIAKGIAKGITDPDQLTAAITAAAARSVDGHALIEPDLRAHHNPSRRVVLTQPAGAPAATPNPAHDRPTQGFTANVSIPLQLPARRLCCRPALCLTGR